MTEEKDRYIYHDDPPPITSKTGAGEYVYEGGLPDRIVKPPSAGWGEVAGETLKDAARSGVNSLWLGGGNRVGGAINYLTGTSKAGSLGGAIDEAVAEEEAGRARSPYASAGAELAGGALTGAALPLKGATLGARVLSGMRTGGALGAAQGAGNTYTGNPADYVGRALTGGAYGGLLGGAAPIIGSIAGSGQRAADAIGVNPIDALVRRISGAPKPEPRIPGALARAAQADEAGLLALQGKHGPEAMLVDAGPAMLAQGQGAVLNPQKPGASALINNLTRRNDQAGNRIRDTVDDIYGPAPVPEHIDPQIGERMRELGQSYDHVLARAEAVDPDVMAHWLRGRVGITAGKGQAAYREALGELHVPGNPDVLDPRPERMQAVRSSFAKQIRDPNIDPDRRDALEQVHRRLTEELQDKVPGIREIDHAYAELGSQQRAIRNDSPGARIFDTGRTTGIRPPVFEDTFREAGQPKGVNVGPSAEGFRLQQASRAELDRKISNKPSVVTLNEVLGKDDAPTANAQRLDIALGGNRSPRLEALQDTEATFKNSYGKIPEGSQTAHKTAAKEGQDEISIPTFSSATAYGDLKAGALALGRKFADATNLSNRDRIAQILSTRDPAEIQAIIPRLLAEQPNRDARANLVESLISGGVLGSGASVIGKRRNQPL